MAAVKLAAFAQAKAAKAFALFDEGAWEEGLPFASASLELLLRAGDVDAEAALLRRRLCRQLCEAHAALGRFGAALALHGRNAGDIADERLREDLLGRWHAAANAAQEGDVVQLTRAACGADGNFGHVVTTVGGLPCVAPAPWAVELAAPPAGAAGAAGAAPLENQDTPGIGDDAAAHGAATAVQVEADEVTLLSLRLMEEQREHWRSLREECPRLFGDELKQTTKANWQRLFGACAAAIGEVPRIAAEADAALPLAYSFAATLLLLLREHAALGGDLGADGCLEVDLMGCRDVLELSDPERQLAAVLACAPPRIRRLHVRMCGPEIVGGAWERDAEADDGRKLHLTVVPGLYHEVFPDVCPHLVVAMNAGFGVATYVADWRPTLDLIARRPRRTLFASTSYTAKEIAQEDALLRRRWAEPLRVTSAAQREELLAALGGGEGVALGPPPWTAQRDAAVPGLLAALRRGDAVFPEATAATAVEAFPEAPATLLVARCADAIYVGPNPTPGRSRNYGRLLRWAGGGPLRELTHKVLSGTSRATEVVEALRQLDLDGATNGADGVGISGGEAVGRPEGTLEERLARVVAEWGEELTAEDVRELAEELRSKDAVGGS